MLKKVENYIVAEYNCPPTKEDIAEAIDVAKNNHCIVSIRWNMKYSGSYQRYIYEDDDVDDVYEIRIPHMYPV